jgi:hypothetical protein
MKILTILLAGFLLGGSLSPAALPVDDSVPAASPATELRRLNAEYELKRARALRPLTAWYRAELERLGKQIQKEGKAVEDAKHSLARTFWEDDQPELKAALLSQKWVWRSQEDGAGVPLEFSASGAVNHPGLHGTWKVTGPNEVTVQPDDDGAFVLRFNASMTLFEGNRRGVTGEGRRPEERREKR